MVNKPQYTLKWLFFGFTGRIRRVTYVLSSVLFLAIYSYLLIQMVQAPEDSLEIGLWGLAFMTMIAVSAWAGAALAAKRLHDMGYSGFLVVLVFVPMVSMIFFLALAFWPGQPEANQYGASPTPGQN